MSVALITIGAWVRYDGSYLVADQLILGLLFFIAAMMMTVALICWLPLLRRLPDNRTPGRTVSAMLLIPALTMSGLIAMAFETKASADARHRSHLIRVARILAKDFERRGRMPVFFEDALQRSDDNHPHRGDADGGTLTYRRIDSQTALLCAPERRVHIVVCGTAIDYIIWPDDSPDPCRSGSLSSYFAGNDGKNAPSSQSP